MAAHGHARAGLGPAPTQRQTRFRILRRGGCPHPPADCAHPLVPLWLLSGPPERNSPPGRRPPPINETALSSSPHPSGLRPATFPYPLCRFATSPLDKGSRPPGGRLFRRIFVSIRITNVSDEGLTCEVEDCLEFTLNFVQTQRANLTKMSGYFLVKCTFLSVFCVVQ